MKSKPSCLLSALWLALALALLPVLHAQQEAPPVAPPPAEQATTTEKSTPDGAAAPADKSVDAEKPAAAPETPAEAAPTPADESQPAVASEPAGDGKKLDEGKADEEEKSVREEEKPKRMRNLGTSSRRRSSNNERVSIFSDSTLAAGEEADAVVSILGSSTSEGTVRDAVVSVLGSSTSSGDVGNAVVSVIGDTRVTGGTVGDVAVAVLGTAYINGHVKGKVVAVLGNVELGPDAVVDGEIVCVGGQVKRDAQATVHGNVQNVAFGGHNFNFTGLQTWFRECLRYARPLAFNSNLLWAWGIALTFLGFYTLIALITPAGVRKCVTTLEERPGYSILSSLLTLLLTPVAYLLLVLTLVIGIGFILMPLLSLGLFFAALFGKVVMLAWLGSRLTKLFGNGPLSHPAFAVIIGGAIVLGLYTIPIVGFIVYKLLGILGLGVVLYTLLLQFQASRPAPRPFAAGAMVAGGGAATAGESPPVSPTLPPVISAATLPRAGFWHRLLASILDAVIVGMAFGMIHSIWHGFGGIFPFWYAVYCVIMWATKGTTIGGIICGLKVVRLDDRPVDWSVAIVRALSGFLSLAVAGLGFIWVVFDDEKQSWHDKIAGTTIVRVPKGTALL